MKKQCWFCKNTEDIFLQQKEESLKSIEKKLIDIDDSEKSIISDTKEKLGFTNELKEKVKNIKKEFSSMTVNAVIENRDSFEKLEPNLSIIIDYLSKYRNQNFKTIKEVIEQYLLEPIESRYPYELKKCRDKKQSLLKTKEKVENIDTYFCEIKFDPSKLESNIKELKYKQSEYQRFNNSRFLQVPIDNVSFNFLGLSEQKIYICPICLSLFVDSANFSLDVMNGVNNAQNADWDDD